jgi:hypothetical protein
VYRPEDNFFTSNLDFTGRRFYITVSEKTEEFIFFLGANSCFFLMHSELHRLA